MRWILLDVAIAGAALAVLAVLVLRLWRRVKALSATVTAAGETLGTATDALAAAQAQGPLGGARGAGPTGPTHRPSSSLPTPSGLPLDRSRTRSGA